MLAGAVVDLDHRRRRAPRLLHELARDLHEVGLHDLAAGRAQQFERLGVQDAHADGADDLEGGLVDGLLVGIAQVGQTARRAGAPRQRSAVESVAEVGTVGSSNGS